MPRATTTGYCLSRLCKGDALQPRIRGMWSTASSLLLLRYIQLVRDREEKLPKNLDRKRTIETFGDSECWNFFEFRKEDLKRLQNGLRIPNTVVLDNGSKCPGEEVLLRGLYELVNGEDKNSIAVNVFGRD